MSRRIFQADALLVILLSVCAFSFSSCVSEDKIDRTNKGINMVSDVENIPIKRIVESKTGLLYMISDHGMFCFDGTNYLRYTSTTDPGSISSNTINDILIDNSGNVWIATQKGIDKLNQATQLFTHFSIDDYNNYTLRILEDNQGRLFALTRIGIFMLDPETSTFNKVISFKKDIDLNLSSKIFIGSSVTADQYAAISAGTFENMYIGDYWTIGGVNWRIADFDYWLHGGDTECTTHHVVIVPDTNLYNAQMNTSNTTTGGYHGSAMYTSNLASAKTTINNAFGSAHILNHRELLTNAISGNDPSGWAWYDSTVELMSEVMAYGTRAWSTANHNGYDVGLDKRQLSLFQHDHSRLCNRAAWWLRDIYSSTAFCGVANDGGANNHSRIGLLWCAPCFRYLCVAPS